MTDSALLQRLWSFELFPSYHNPRGFLDVNEFSYTYFLTESRMAGNWSIELKYKGIFYQRPNFYSSRLQDFLTSLKIDAKLKVKYSYSGFYVLKIH